MRILVDIDNTCIDSNLEIIRQYREHGYEITVD